MKRKTKKQQYAAIAALITGKSDQPTSERTRPTIQSAARPERDVLAECLSWCKRRQIQVDRLNSGKGILVPYSVAYTGGADAFCRNNGCVPRVYGIPGAGDIIGLLPNGRHLEIECKHGRGGTLLQEQVKRRMIVERNGGLYLVVHSAEELEALMLPHLPRDPLFNNLLEEI